MKTDIERVPGIGPHSAEVLSRSGFASVASLADATVDQLSAVPGFGAARARKVIRSAAALVAERVSDDADTPAVAVSETASRGSGASDTPAKQVDEGKTPLKKGKKKKKKKKKKKRSDPISVWAAYKRSVRKQGSST